MTLGWMPLINNEFYRADGRVICSVCKLCYSRHPVYPLFRFLRIICNGDLVKL